MEVVTRKVKEDEKACRVCTKFNMLNTCWIHVENEFGETCTYFERNFKIKKVLDLVGEANDV